MKAKRATLDEIFGADEMRKVRERIARTEDQEAAPQWLSETGQGVSRLIDAKRETISGRDCLRMVWETPKGRAQSLADINSRKLIKIFRALGLQGEEGEEVTGREAWVTWGARTTAAEEVYPDACHYMPPADNSPHAWLPVDAGRWSALGRDAHGFRVSQSASVDDGHHITTDYSQQADPPPSITTTAADAVDYGSGITAANTPAPMPEDVRAYLASLARDDPKNKWI